MAIIHENQTKEWQWKYSQLMIAQAGFDRYHEVVGEPEGFDISEHINWDRLFKEAEQNGRI